MLKELHKVYRITWIDPESSWAAEQEKLIGYRGELLSAGTKDFITLKMLEGPHARQTIAIAGARLKLAPKVLACRCSAYQFPHRAGGGLCATDDIESNELASQQWEEEDKQTKPT